MMLSNFIDTLCADKEQNHLGCACGPLKWSMSATSGAVRP
ncbi:hypothetical protein JOH51_001949 [Rhizobium leguminosarum]|nr:hypothetical protein [Rhizobium leguminosarum]